MSGKTGFTGKAGYCYVGALKKDGKTFVVSLLACGWPNNKTYKWKDTRKLMEYGLKNYEYASFEEAAEGILKEGKIPVLGGQTQRIGRTAYAQWESVKQQEEQMTKGVRKDKEEEFLQEEAETIEEGILLRKDEEIEVKWELEEKLEAPIEAGYKVGRIQYLIGKEVYGEEFLVVKNSIEKIDYEWCIKRVLEIFEIV